MQVIPVFDLKGGSLVHAVGGNRSQYLPLRTKLIPDPDPSRACEILVNLGFHRIYIADLDAITRTGNNLALVRTLAERFAINIWLDAGLTGEGEPPLLDLPNVNWVAASETLASLHLLPRLMQWCGAGTVIFSLDMEGGRVISADRSGATSAPYETAVKVLEHGIRDFIVLDLKAVGTGAGVALQTVVDLAQRLPNARIIPGGGLVPQDIAQLQRISVYGVLTGTALYAGQIPARPEL